MRKIILIVLVQLLLIIKVYAQINEKIYEEKKSLSYPIDGTHLLWKEDEKVASFLKANPNFIEQQKLNKKSAWNFTVGSKKSWYAVDFTNNNTSYLTNSTCRAVGTNCYIFVEDAAWNSKVNQTIVDSIKAAFDNRTPANATKGIYQTNTETFGYPPDVDNDPKIIIFLLDIKDGYDGDGGYIMGYFSSSNEVGYNNAEIFFIDCNPLDLSTSSGLRGGMSTLAHEFQHMIHWNYHRTKSQHTFINEGCSLVAEVICGYPIYSQGGYTGETNHYLLDWRGTLSDDVLKDYSRAARFNVYLRDQFGTPIFRKIVESQQYGVDAYIDALSKIGANITFKNLLINWFIANNLDDKTINSAWGYDYKNLTKPYGKLCYNPNIVIDNTVEPYAVEYITLKGGENIKATFSTKSTSIVIKAILIGTSQKSVIDIPSNGIFSEPGFGTTYSTITFIIMNPENQFDQAYTCSISGISKSVELKWDDKEPVGYLKRPPLDTICVTFDAVEGGRLDSIKVAARRVGTLTGAVYKFTGLVNPSPLGKRLSEIFTLTSTKTPTYPYDVPYPNWLTADLKSQNIKTDNSFAVAFGVPQDTSKFAYIMVTTYASSSSYHSFTYMNSPSETSSPGWYYLTDGSGNVWLYLIRAYVGFENTNKVVELQPKVFHLNQNYPNPFNPETKIKFSLDKSGQTKLVVYDVMGREVKTLLDEYKNAGDYEITFRPTNLSSGVFYYKLQQNDCINIRKMVLLK